MNPKLSKLTLSDELPYKKFIIDSGRWREDLNDPEWKKDIFVKDFDEVVAEYDRSGSRIIKYETKIIAEFIKNKNHSEIIVLPELRNLELEQGIHKQVKKYQIKELVGKIRLVPEMIKRLVKYLPSWL